MLKEAAALELVPSPNARVVEERTRMVQWLKQRLALSAEKPITEIVTLTPVLAELLLDANPDNRPVSATNLDRIKRDIAEGLFEFNGESVIVARDGKLNNGQHRCIGVVESGRPIRVVMVFGVERQTRMTLDQGVTRTVGHFLGMQGYSNSNVVGAAAGFSWQHEHGFTLSSSGKGPRATKSQILEFVNKHPDLLQSVDFVTGRQSGVGASKSLLAFCHFAVAHRLPKVDALSADEFLDTLMIGSGLRKGSPILYVRNRLIDMRRMGQRQVNTRAQLIFMAWNAHRRGTRNVTRMWADESKPLPILDA